MDTSDRYARLRDNLLLHRAMTAQRSEMSWCRACEVHLADDSGLCPVCRPLPVPVNDERLGDAA